MTNNSDEQVSQGIQCEHDDDVGMSDSSNVQNQSNSTNESVDSLTENIDENCPPQASGNVYDSQGILSLQAQEQLNNAIETLCNKFTIKNDLSKKPTVDKEDNINSKEEYVPSPSDLIIDSKNESKKVRTTYNNIVRQCSMHAFVGMTAAMSQILTNAQVNIPNYSSALRKYKKDIELASKMLLSVKNVAHGLFLGQGGYYSQRVHDRLITNLNAQTNLIRERGCFHDINQAKKMMSTFLSHIQCQSGMISTNTKPKRLCIKPSSKASVVTITKLPFSKLQVKFKNGQTLTIPCPKKPPIYSPAELFTILESQVPPKCCCALMMVLSKNLGHALIPVAFSGARQAYLRYRKTGNVK